MPPSPNPLRRHGRPSATTNRFSHRSKETHETCQSSRRALLRAAGGAALAIPAGAMAPHAFAPADPLAFDPSVICRANAASGTAAAAAPGPRRRLKLTWNANAICTVGVPVAFFAFSSSRGAGTFLITLASVFPVTVLTWSGISLVSKANYDVARTMRASPRFLVRKVVILTAMPSVFVGLFTGLGASFSVQVVAEMMGVKTGLR